jgi:phospholipase/carboxylesterase
MKLLLFALILSITVTFAVTRGKAPQPATPMLEYLVRQPTIPSEKPPLLLMLHGVGSNEQDLFSFAPQIDGRFLVVSARAPFTIAPGSYKWYSVDFSGGKPVIDAEQAERSRQILLQFIGQLAEKHAFDATKVYCSGFSQGAIMSFSLGLTAPDRVRGIAAFSGRVLEEIKPIMAEKAQLGKLSAFISHGTADGTLPVHYARESKQLLDSLGILTEYHEYGGVGHGISSDNLRDFLGWLGKQ